MAYNSVPSKLETKVVFLSGKKVILCFVFFIFGMISFGSAFQANVTVIDDIGSFSGAYLKVKSVDSDVFSSDKIYPSEFLTNVGIVKFNLEVSFSEIYLKIKMIKDGQVVADFEEGPFVINGSDIIIDRREKAEVVGEVVENVSESINESVAEVANESANESENVVEVVNESSNETVVIVEDAVLGGKKTSGVLAGMASFYNEDGSLNLKYLLGGGFVFLLLLSFVLTMVFYRRKTSGVTMGEDEKELKYMEKKVKETEKKIAKIKDGRAQRKKLEKVKVKLAEEETELKELESEGDEKKIEQQEKAIDKAENKVKKVKGEG